METILVNATDKPIQLITEQDLLNSSISEIISGYKNTFTLEPCGYYVVYWTKKKPKDTIAGLRNVFIEYNRPYLMKLSDKEIDYPLNHFTTYLNERYNYNKNKKIVVIIELPALQAIINEYKTNIVDDITYIAVSEMSGNVVTSITNLQD